MPVLDTVWRFLATNNLRFFLSLNELAYWPYRNYIRDSDNINDEGEWDIRVGEPVNQFYHPDSYNVVDFIEPHYDILLAEVCPYTTAITGDISYPNHIYPIDNESLRMRLLMWELLEEASDGWRSMRWK